MLLYKAIFLVTGNGVIIYGCKADPTSALNTKSKGDVLSDKTNIDAKIKKGILTILSNIVYAYTSHPEKRSQ